VDFRSFSSCGTCKGKVEGLQKGMRVTVTPSAADPGKAEKVEATKAVVEEKKDGDTEE